MCHDQGHTYFFSEIHSIRDAIDRHYLLVELIGFELSNKILMNLFFFTIQSFMKWNADRIVEKVLIEEEFFWVNLINLPWSFIGTFWGNRYKKFEFEEILFLIFLG